MAKDPLREAPRLDCVNTAVADHPRTLITRWADGVWVLVVVLSGYVALLRGLAPRALFVVGARFTTIARHAARKFPGVAI